MNHITMVHNANCDRKQLGTLELLNVLTEYILECVSPNLIDSLRMFLTTPLAVASAERGFGKLKLITDYLRSTVDLDRLYNLASVSIESDIARKWTDTVIRSFA